MVSRRLFLTAAVAAPVAATAASALPLSASATSPAGDLAALRSLTTGAKPITVEERRARIAKLQDLMGRQGIGAFLVESGSSLDYFTGIRWHRSERTTAAVIPAKGEVVVVTPAFEEPSVRETLQVGGDVRPWDEHESPFQRLAQALKDGGVAKGKVAVEPTTRFFIIDGIRQLTQDYDLVSGDGLVRACRMHKSPAELALMQLANEVTLAALRYAHAHVQPGMRAADIGALVDSATAALGGRPDFSLVLLNEASAYPHGSLLPEVVKEGSTVLLDCGCGVHGYQSDISRTWVFGTPSAKQRKVWQTVKRGQEIALETAKPGIPVGDIDRAVRRHYEAEGWGPGYHLPGLSHRTGHGIGLDGHESPYLVLSDTTPLEAGMCFSDEPGLYIPGEFGIRLEDCWHMTDTGPTLFTPLAASIDQPV
ncbi:M24 family metallopeptidase [Nitrospirillum iridis]|uniref:Xaa-Pro dipeptidase n=1 Tax=Nitrospirillum iridis TaxID=765888 RepID=A0A7X0AVP4_9PROT|nr:Xaa-Pro peptidase family protein [Nitrospirillum iridis]MBB6249534.1 Xaa-Pro dipeptidase [Nitrospirillum iridis]